MARHIDDPEVLMRVEWSLILARPRSHATLYGMGGAWDDAQFIEPARWLQMLPRVVEFLHTAYEIWEWLNP